MADEHQAATPQKRPRHPGSPLWTKADTVITASRAYKDLVHALADRVVEYHAWRHVSKWSVTSIFLCNAVYSVSARVRLSPGRSQSRSARRAQFAASTPRTPIGTNTLDRRSRHAW